MRNKALVATCILMLSFGGKLLAQSERISLPLTPREKFVFGVKAGINRSNVWDTKGQDFKADSKTGFAGGVFFGIPLSRYIGIQPEILVSQKGYQSTGGFLGTTYSNSRTTTFVDVPVFLALKPNPFFTLLAGPQYSYLANQKDVTTFGNNSSTTEQDFKNENIRKNIFGMAVGIDVNIRHIVVSGRGGWDLTNNHGDGTSDVPRYRNRWAQLTLGVRI